MWGSDSLCYSGAGIWITGGATQLCVYNRYQLLSESRINKHGNDVINSPKTMRWEPTEMLYGLNNKRISLMNVHATVSTTVCKALVSDALVLPMCHLSCHRQFTRLGTRVAICPTSVGCTEGRFAQFWHAWLHLMLYKCLETLHKQWDLHQVCWGNDGRREGRRWGECSVVRESSSGALIRTNLTSRQTKVPGCIGFAIW